MAYLNLETNKTHFIVGEAISLRGRVDTLMSKIKISKINVYFEERIIMVGDPLCCFDSRETKCYRS